MNSETAQLVDLLLDASGISCPRLDVRLVMRDRAGAVALLRCDVAEILVRTRIPAIRATVQVVARRTGIPGAEERDTQFARKDRAPRLHLDGLSAVSYTHLTLPTICSV